jgi:hypothetical protein
MEIEDTFYNFLEEPCEETANELEDEDAVMLVVVANEVIESDDVVHIEDGDITYNVDVELAEQILDVLQEPYFPATLNGGVLMRNKDRVEMKEYEYYLVTDLLVSSFDVKKCEEIIVKLPNLTNLFIDGYFSAEMVVLHHPNLKKLTFDNYFNQPVNLNFPSLTHLTFRGFFNQTVGNLDVPNLTHLTFGNYFNQPIDNLNVPNLTHLAFGDNFNQSINSLNVPHLTHLVLGFMFRQPVDNAKFQALKQIIFDNIPVKYIDDLNSLLLQYSKKKFNMTYTKPISAMLRGGILKNKATGLQVGKSEYYLITVLTVFHTNEDKDYEIINSLPNLTYVDFSGYFEKPINNLNLQTLTHLTFGNGFNQPINTFVAPNLTHLTFGDIFNQPITNFVAPNLSYLELGKSFDKHINTSQFPKLTHFIVGGNKVYVPNSIITIPHHTTLNKNSTPKNNPVAELKIKPQEKIAQDVIYGMGVYLDEPFDGITEFNKVMKNVEEPYKYDYDWSYGFTTDEKEEKIIEMHFVLVIRGVDDYYDEDDDDEVMFENMETSESLNFPELKRLKLDRSIITDFNGANLPELTHLYLDNVGGKVYGLTEKNFPELTELHITHFSHAHLPKLTHLFLRGHDEGEISQKDFPSLTHLKMGGSEEWESFSYRTGTSVVFDLPKLTHLSIFYVYYEHLENMNFPNLTHLDWWVQQPINNLDLPKLTHLSFQWFPKEPFTNLNLPNLEYLDLGLYDGGQGYLQYIEGLNFPKLKEATINGQPINISVFRRDTNLTSNNVVSDYDDLIDAKLRDGKLMTLGGEEINEERYHLVTTLDAHVRPPTVTGYGYHHYYCGDLQDIRYDDDYDGAEDDDYDEMEKTDDCYYNYYGYDVNRRHHHRYNDDEMKEDEELISKLPNLTSLTRVDFDEPGICELVNCYYYEERLRFSREDSSEYLHYPKLTYLDLKNSYVNNLLDAHLPKLKTFIFDNIEGKFPDNFPELEFLDIHYFYAHPWVEFPKLTHLTIDKMLITTISKEMFPSLTHLTFGDNFNEIVFLDVPTLTHLTFGRKFNQMIKYLNVPNLTHLTFGDNFNQPINILNFPNLTYLKIALKYKEYLSKIKADKLSISYVGY